MPRSPFGGRHELGQNFLRHAPTIALVRGLVASTSGPILEIGAGDGALTRAIADLGRPVTAIEIDEHWVGRLARELPHVRVRQADALTHPLREPVVVGNLPFHLTTPLLRRLLAATTWRHAVLLTQWEVARKRAGVGGATLMTAQAAPWFEFGLHGRVPARAFSPAPAVDAGVLSITRRADPLVPLESRLGYESFVRAAFTGSGGSLARVLARASGSDPRRVARALTASDVAAAALPRDLRPDQWARLWDVLGRRRPTANERTRR